jgi:hypothetical protein
MLCSNQLSYITAVRPQPGMGQKQKWPDPDLVQAITDDSWW